MAGIEQYRAYRVMIVLFRSLWFLGDVVGQCAQALEKDVKDISFLEFGDWFFGLDKDERRVKFKFAVLFGASLDQDEMLAVCSFRKDKNGVAISKENIRNLTMTEIVDFVSDVCADLSEEKVFF